ncbi:hypothetical protein AB0J80_04210 [Actinoplanes sp. NPDC049548]|uniref:hypothetical protein n=1 Tax=Actinoplanes sp. NPDC049548 TaxID=3155152 RepID=UPI00342E9C5E
MTRTRIALTLTTLGLAGLLGLTGCGAPATDVTDEAYALTAVEAPASAPPTQGQRGLRKHLRKNTLHGEITVQGKDGVKTIVVQRGTVTAVDSQSVSVKSTDGFAQTWTFDDKLRVLQDRKTVERSALKTGVEVGVAGGKEGDGPLARLIVLRQG